MGGSAKPPKQSDQSAKAERMNMQLMEEQLKQAKKPVEIPEIKTPKPLPPPPPPAGAVSGDVAAAEEAARRAAGRRTNTAKGTLFAGETGGYKGSLGGSKTLLG